MEAVIAKENTTQHTFLWLMEHLLPLNDKFKGCELIFPDTVFFSRGKPIQVIKSDRDFCL
jgi:hypothetical protein